MRPLKKILVALDYSKCADEALDRAASLARQTGSQLFIVHVIAPFEPAYFTHVNTPAAEGGRDVAEEKKLFEHVARRLGRTRVVRDVELEWGDPAEEIIAAAKRRKCDLISIGRNGQTAWHRLLMGSVAEKVVRQAFCPVLIEHPAGRARRKSARVLAPRRVTARTRPRAAA